MTVSVPEAQGLWLLGIAGSLLGAAGLVAWLRVPGRPYCWLRDALGIALALAAVAAIVSGQAPRLWAPALALASLWFLAWLMFRGQNDPSWQGAVRRSLVLPMLWSAVLIGSPLAAFALSQAGEPEAPPLVRSYAPPAASPSLSVAWQRLPWKRSPVQAVTDAGRPIPLYTLAADSAKLQKLMTRAAQLDEDVRQELAPTDGMIRTAEADPGADCHGWVFTGGRHLIDGQDVEAILQDNGYEMVEAPLAGDLAIYRDPAGKIRHSGVVVAIMDKRLPLIESKWGFIGRYISPSSNHMYGKGCTYYRSSRRGHHLLLSDVEPSTASAR